MVAGPVVRVRSYRIINVTPSPPRPSREPYLAGNDAGVHKGRPDALLITGMLLDTFFLG